MILRYMFTAYSFLYIMILRYYDLNSRVRSGQKTILVLSNIRKLDRVSGTDYLILYNVIVVATTYHNNKW